MQGIKQRLSGLLGRSAEKRASKYLTAQGLRFVAANYRCKTGEIDLIMQDKDELVFVEVKYRTGTRYGHPAEYFDKKNAGNLNQHCFIICSKKD